MAVQVLVASRNTKKLGELERVLATASKSAPVNIRSPLPRGAATGIDLFHHQLAR